MSQSQGLQPGQSSGSAEQTSQPDSCARAFVFAGGGTGGHVYPAIAVIEQLRVLSNAHSFQLTSKILCSDRSVDEDILSRTDIDFASLPAQPVSTKPKGLLRFVRAWGPSLRQTRLVLRDLKKQHDQVTFVAMGGFVAAPAARAAHLEKVPVVLVNLDAVPGKANMLIAKKANRIITACALTHPEQYPSWESVQPIVRQEVLSPTEQSQARKHFCLDPDTKTLLITGGSQGALSINALVMEMIKLHPACLKDWQVIHQVGEKMSDQELQDLRATYADVEIKFWCERYIDEIGIALSAADLSIGRCGAGTVAECWAKQVPSIFFPYPYHQDDHQRLNAQPLVDAGCALVLTDQIDPHKNLNEHLDQLKESLQNPDQLAKMRSSFESIGHPDGSLKIAKQLFEHTS